MKARLIHSNEPEEGYGSGDQRITASPEVSRWKEKFKIR